MKRALWFCLVPLCISGFQTTGEATTYLWWQTNFTAEHSQIVPDGDGYDVLVILKGKSSANGQICTAAIKGPTEPFCPGSDVITNADGSVTRQAR